MGEGRHFQRRVEDFVCLDCRRQVAGNGYTNHCPHCLWSRHVDRFPGDRAEACQGAMRPIAVIPQRDTYRIRHICLDCGKENETRTQPNDDFSALLRIARASQTVLPLPGKRPVSSGASNQRPSRRGGA